MDQSLIIMMLVLLGLCFGSFVNALVWRLRHHRDMVKERSECTHCHHVLAWNDLVPVVSWLMLRGKCRYCHKPIDDSPIVEVATAVLFVISYLAWPFSLDSASGVGLLVLWLICSVALVALTVYDIKWYLLPDRIVFPLIALGVVWAFVRYRSYAGMSLGATLLEMVLGVIAIAGLYWALYMVSKGAWVGFGDVKLGIFIGLVLGWKFALLAVFLANLAGLVWVLPSILRKKISMTSHIPFGPFLIAGCFVALLWGGRIVDWYLQYILAIS